MTVRIITRSFCGAAVLCFVAIITGWLFYWFPAVALIIQAPPLPPMGVPVILTSQGAGVPVCASGCTVRNLQKAIDLLPDTGGIVYLPAVSFTAETVSEFTQ